MAVSEFGSLDRRPKWNQNESRFYIGMGLVAVAIVIVGFSPWVLPPSQRKAPLTTQVVVHGVVFGAWLLFFIAQSALVAARRVKLHRRMGWVGAVLAVCMVLTGSTTAVALARRGFDLSGDLHSEADPLGLLVFQLGDLLSFSILVGLGVYYRRRPDVHKRLMLLATVGSLMAAPISHWIGRTEALRQLPPPIILVPLILLYSSSALHDVLTKRRIHPVSFWGAIGLFVWANLRAAVNSSEPWRRFAAWLVG